ncbi:RING-H2 finger protein ATL80 [Syzygium oleosum]|uniref:RING-H2 finger protein ATL80 n=1 Tax=Syzygium oleosum TaxID=219896 RepID=UPI0024BA9958|nr:RING-H2 finger protein ATL80 [Syzygium oleosum]
MTRHRFLGGAAANSSAAAAAAGPPQAAVPVDSDYVVILAALLCALICVLGLVAVARCAWLRRLASPSSFAAGAPRPPPPAPPPPPSKANKGLKKKILRSLPKLTFTPDSAARFSDCTICLAEFADGDEIRVLPHCGHAFHVACIDPWLGSHSSCPSCRRILVAATAVCDKCGNLPAATPGSSSISGTAEEESRMKQREDHDSGGFLP